MQYREENKAWESARCEYVDGLNELIKNRTAKLDEERHQNAKSIFSEPEKYRDMLKNMLGWPLNEYIDRPIPKITTEKIGNDGEIIIYRAKIQIFDELTLNGIYFTHDDAKKRPLIIAQHGGYGTPEFASGFINGDSANYNGMVEEILKYDVDVFAPQLLLWNVERFGAEHDRNTIDKKLKHVGSSVFAVEVFAITRSIDYFESQGYTSFSMVGLSYGSQYTILTSAIDKRITSCVASCSFTDRNQYDWNDWIWFDSASKLHDAETVCLIYPRKIRIQIGNNDPIFNSEYGKKEYEVLKSLCTSVGMDWCEFTVFDGEHEFYHGNDAIKHLIDDLAL